jgi:transcription initiation factor TFIIB
MTSCITKPLHMRAGEEKLHRGEPLSAIVGACVFIAYRQAEMSYAFREVCNPAHVSKKMLVQSCEALEQASLPGRTRCMQASQAWQYSKIC